MDVRNLDRLDEENRRRDLNEFLDDLMDKESESHSIESKDLVGDYRNHNHSQQQSRFLGAMNSDRGSQSQRYDSGADYLDDDGMGDADEELQEFMARPGRRTALEHSLRKKTLIRFNNTTSSFDAGVPDELQNSALLRREDGEAVRRLLNDLHEKQVEMTKMQLQLNHANLQIEALMGSEQQSRYERDALKFTLASVEQDKLLLEVRLKEVAGFEHQSRHILVDEIRGRLLHIANMKLTEMSHAVQDLEQRCEDQENAWTKEVDELSYENQALRQELKRLSDQIAQRTVLYAAQERRALDQSNTQTYHIQSQEKELIEMKGKYQELKSIHTVCDQERQELFLEKNSLQMKLQQLTNVNDELNEQIVILTQDVQEITAKNMELQSMIDSLRGSDADQMEMNVMKELERIQIQAKMKEDNLKTQLESLRERLSEESHQVDVLMNEREEMQGQLSRQNDLLSELERSGFINGGNTSLISSLLDQSKQREAAQPHASKRLFADTSLIGGRADEEVHTQNNPDGINSEVDDQPLVVESTAQRPSQPQGLTAMESFLLGLDDNDDEEEISDDHFVSSPQHPGVSVNEADVQTFYLHRLKSIADKLISALKSKLQTKDRHGNADSGVGVSGFLLHSEQQIAVFTETVMHSLLQSEQNGDANQQTQGSLSSDEYKICEELIRQVAHFIVQSVHAYFGIRSNAGGANTVTGSDEASSMGSSIATLSTTVTNAQAAGASENAAGGEQNGRNKHHRTQKEIALKKEVKALKAFLSKVLTRVGQLNIQWDEQGRVILPTAPAPVQPSGQASSHLQEQHIKALQNALEVMEEEKNRWAEQHNALREEIAQLQELVITKQEIGRSEGREACEAQIDSLTRRCAALMDDKKTADKLYEETLKKMEDAEKKIEALNRTVREQEEESTRKSRELAEMREKILAASAQVLTVKEEESKERKKLQSMHEETIAILEKEKNTISIQLTELQNRYDAFVADNQQQIQELKDAIKTLKDDATAAAVAAEEAMKKAQETAKAATDEAVQIAIDEANEVSAKSLADMEDAKNKIIADLEIAMNNLQEELNALKELSDTKVIDLIAERDRALDAQSHWQTICEECVRVKENLMKEVSELTDVVNKLNERVDEEEQLKLAYEAELFRLRDESVRDRDTMQGLSDEIQSLTEKAETLTESNTRLQDDLSSTMKALEEANRDLNEETEMVESYRRGADELYKKIQTSQEKIQRLTERESILMKEVESVKSTLTTKVSMCESLEKELSLLRLSRPANVTNTSSASASVVVATSITENIHHHQHITSNDTSAINIETLRQLNQYLEEYADRNNKEVIHVKDDLVQLQRAFEEKILMIQRLQDEANQSVTLQEKTNKELEELRLNYQNLQEIRLRQERVLQTAQDEVEELRRKCYIMEETLRVSSSSTTMTTNTRMVNIELQELQLKMKQLEVTHKQDLDKAQEDYQIELQKLKKLLRTQFKKEFSEQEQRYQTLQETYQDLQRRKDISDNEILKLRDEQLLHREQRVVMEKEMKSRIQSYEIDIQKLNDTLESVYKRYGELLQSVANTTHTATIPPVNDDGHESSPERSRHSSSSLSPQRRSRISRSEKAIDTSELHDTSHSVALSTTLLPPTGYITEEEAMKRLQQQKEKLIYKFNKRFNKQEAGFAIERDQIMQLVKAQCHEVAEEAQKLVEMKRDLVWQQAQYNDAVAEMSMRSPSVFSTPARTVNASGNVSFMSTSGPRGTSRSTGRSGGSGGSGSGNRSQSHGYTVDPTYSTVTPSTVNASNIHAPSSSSPIATPTAATNDPVSYSSSLPRPAPFPNVLSSSINSLSSAVQSIREANQAITHQQPPAPIPRTVAQQSFAAATNKDKMRESLTSVTSSITASVVPSSAPQQYQQHRIYPEMLSPELTKKLVEGLSSRDPNFIAMTNSNSGRYAVNPPPSPPPAVPVHLGNGIHTTTNSFTR